MEKSKGTTLFRILVIVLLAANLAVSTLVYVRLGRSGQDVPKETGAVSEETVKAADSAEMTAVPETPEAPETASDAPVYDYTWAYSRSDRVEISRLRTEEDAQAGESCWIFRITLPGAEEDMVLTEIQINDMIDGKITAEHSAPEWIDHLDDLNGLPRGETTVLPASGSLYWEDAHPYTEDFNGREYRFIFTASGGEVSYSYIYELDGSPASRTAAQTPADYSTDNGRDLAALRCDAGFEIEVFEGVYWVNASALGKTRFTNAQVYRLLSDTPEEKQAEISTLYEALQLYQISDFRSADDNIRIEENGIDWEYHTPGRLAVENNRGCCATDSAWLRYILDGDYDELGYISTSQRDGSGHIYNYIRDGEWYYIIDLTHYRNDADIGLTTVIENGDIDSYMRSDRVLGNIHRTKDLRCFVNYVQDAFNDPPGLMFRLTCENVPPIDGVSTGNGIAITHPESYEPYITCIFDDPSDTLTHTYAPDPTRDPYK